MNQLTPTTRLRMTSLALGLLSLAASCQPATDSGGSLPPGLAERADAIKAPLAQAYCQVNVTSKGVKATEEDYLPHVVACEDGDGDTEALKAQAVIARSALYWTVASHGSICDSQACQVYSCSRQPEAKHYAAVKATAGQYLAYNGQVTYGFFVNGSSKLDASCKNVGGSSLDHYITFNEGKSGTSVAQTSLGYVGAPGNGQNRGCLSQFGSNCLSAKGKSYTDILRFYYGSDIQLLDAPGACSQPPASVACSKDADCSNNTPGEGVVCSKGACVDGCHGDSDCASGGTCAKPSSSSPGTCSGAPKKLGSACQSDADCGAGAGRVCGASTHRCIIGCHGDGDCGANATCDKSSAHYRCVKRREQGQECGNDSDCNGGIDGTTRICVNGTCGEGCHGSFDCHGDEQCNKTTHDCEPKPDEPSAPDSSCVLTYPSVTLRGVATPDDVKKQYAQRGCASEVPACMLDVNNLVNDKTGKKMSYSHVRLSPNFTLRELSYQSAQVSPYVYVAPALVEALQRTRQVHGAIPVSSGFRSAAKQAQICKAMCGKSTCKNTKGASTCAQCSEHMDGKAADLVHSSPKCTLASQSCDPGQFHLIYNEGAGGDHLHVDLGKSPVCTYESLSCGKGKPDDTSSSAPPSSSGPSSSGPPGSDPESPAASNGPCLDQLKALGVAFAPTTKRNVVDAVRLTGPLHGVTIADETGTSTSSQAFSCTLVRHLYDFMGELSQAGIVRVGSLGSYCLRCCCSWSTTNQCRDANDPFPQCGSKGLSNHSYGRALDIRYLARSDGTVLDINSNSDWVRHGSFSHPDTCGAGLQAQSGTSLFLYNLACNGSSLFSTFLTPNHNADHRNHWHIDVGVPGSSPGNSTVHLTSPITLGPSADLTFSDESCGNGSSEDASP